MGAPRDRSTPAARRLRGPVHGRVLVATRDLPVAMVKTGPVGLIRFDAIARRVRRTARREHGDPTGIISSTSSIQNPSNMSIQS